MKHLESAWQHALFVSHVLHVSYAQGQKVCSLMVTIVSHSQQSRCVSAVVSVLNASVFKLRLEMPRPLFGDRKKQRAPKELGL